MKRSKFFEYVFPIIFLLMGLLLVAALIGGTVYGVSSALHREDAYACRVIDKEAVASGDSNEYRVYTENCDTLTVSDSLFAQRWDSSNVYAQIQPGQTYDFHLQGYRVPFISQFKNILEVTPGNG